MCINLRQRIDFVLNWYKISLIIIRISLKKQLLLASGLFTIFYVIDQNTLDEQKITKI